MISKLSNISHHFTWCYWPMNCDSWNWWIRKADLLLYTRSVHALMWFIISNFGVWTFSIYNPIYAINILQYVKQQHLSRVTVLLSRLTVLQLKRPVRLYQWHRILWTTVAIASVLLLFWMLTNGQKSQGRPRLERLEDLLACRDLLRDPRRHHPWRNEDFAGVESIVKSDLVSVLQD